MKTVKAFGGSKEYTLVAGTTYKETDLIPMEEGGHLSFVAKIDITGTTVTPTLYYDYGSEVGAAQSLANNDLSDASTFV